MEALLAVPKGILQLSANDTIMMAAIGRLTLTPSIVKIKLVCGSSVSLQFVEVQQAEEAYLL